MYSHTRVCFQMLSILLQKIFQFGKPIFADEFLEALYSLV